MDVSEWLAWFLDVLRRAIDQAHLSLDAVLSKARFWQHWAAIAKCSPDTALRDINELMARGVLRKSAAGGRSTSYELEDLP
jgi:Fic family protein